ncbi:DUF3662 and FHA domain-containing protein [Saxibacter everestensis]|uniref:DUF3662 and FHA domain-containing protein n=1 Tax=Saxibacter everestensis TaxID=2909229 RepID=A0ABY8QS42_9MICO|nr:DUF3662 and FHA domain-containing protein [Brevibacteriaceae bacterium ZFBP1038]
MGVLDRFEKGIERAVNGAFAKAFRSEVQPVELAGALRRETDSRAAVVSRGRTLTANSFTIELSQNDFDRFQDLSDALSGELRQVVGEHAASQGYSFVGPVTVHFEEVGDLDTGMYRVRSTTQRPDGSSAAQPANRGGYDPQSRSHPIIPDPHGQQSHSGAAAAGAGAYAAGRQRPGNPVRRGVTPPGTGYPGGTPAPATTHQATPQAAVDIDGVQHPLTKSITVFGRSGTDADIVLDDPGVSRRHFEIRLEGTHATAVDLGSTNGTFIHGQRITKVALTEGTVVSAGRTDVVFTLNGTAKPT